MARAKGRAPRLFDRCGFKSRRNFAVIQPGRDFQSRRFRATRNVTAASAASCGGRFLAFMERISITKLRALSSI